MYACLYASYGVGVQQYCILLLLASRYMPLRPAQDSWLAALPQFLEISGLSGQGTNANRVYRLTLTDQRVESVVYVAADGSGAIPAATLYIPCASCRDLDLKYPLCIL